MTELQPTNPMALGDPAITEPAIAGPAIGGRGLRGAIRDFSHNRMGMIGLAVIVVMLLFSFVGPLLYPTNQTHPNLLLITHRPSAQFPLGTDAVGYNVLGRLMVAGQSTLEVGLAAAAIATIVGTLWGAVAGYVGGWVDSVMMRIVDALLAIPALLLVLLLTTLVTPSVVMVIFVLGLISWLITARLVRGQVLVLRRLEYVQAAHQMGERAWRIVGRHLVRNVIGTVVVQATFEVANAILLFAALSFLGLGPPPPAANWGGMLNDGLNYVFDGYWWLIYPAGLLIVITVVAFNLIGDAIRNSLEVRLRSR
ncbi:MAG: ABC transporter permease [Streptosporangiaceae bacterium]